MNYDEATLLGQEIGLCQMPPSGISWGPMSVTTPSSPQKSPLLFSK